MKIYSKRIFKLEVLMESTIIIMMKKNKIEIELSNQNIYKSSPYSTNPKRLIKPNRIIS